MKAATEKKLDRSAVRTALWIAKIAALAVCLMAGLFSAYIEQYGTAAVLLCVAILLGFFTVPTEPGGKIR